MENLREKFELCGKNYSEKDLKLVEKALEFARANLDGKKEFSGKSFLDFNVEIGDILVMNELRSEEHTSELQSHSFISYAVFCLKKKTNFFTLVISMLFLITVF